MGILKRDFDIERKLTRLFTFHQVTFQDILEIEDLTIAEKEITCLMGESGSGKSTLLKLMNRLYSPDRGAITFKGTPIHEMDPIELRRQAVMLSQQPVLFGETIRENLEAGLLFSNKPTPSDSEMTTSLQDFHLQKGLDEKADKLSGGEQQRLAFARIILMDPEVFLLDEPTSALDEELEHEVMERFIQHARSHSKTVIYVTHSKAIAEHFSDRIIDITKYSKKGRGHNGR